MLTGDSSSGPDDETGVPSGVSPETGVSGGVGGADTEDSILMAARRVGAVRSDDTGAGPRLGRLDSAISVSTLGTASSYVVSPPAGDPGPSSREAGRDEGREAWEPDVGGVGKASAAAGAMARDAATRERRAEAVGASGARKQAELAGQLRREALQEELDSMRAQLSEAEQRQRQALDAAEEGERRAREAEQRRQEAVAAREAEEGKASKLREEVEQTTQRCVRILSPLLH